MLSPVVTIHRALSVGCGIVEFRQRNVEECKRRYRFAAIFLLVYGRALSVPGYLVVAYPLVATNAAYSWFVVSVDAI